MEGETEKTATIVAVHLPPRRDLTEFSALLFCHFAPTAPPPLARGPLVAMGRTGLSGYSPIRKKRRRWSPYTYPLGAK